MRFVLTLAAACLAVHTYAADKPPSPPAGNYVLWVGPTPTVKQRLAVISFDAAGQAKTVAGAPRTPAAKLGEVKAIDGRIEMPVTFGTTAFTFVSGPGPAAKGVVGSLGNADSVFRAGLEPTDASEIAAADVTVRDEPDPAVTEAAKPLIESRQVARAALRETDDAKKAELSKKAEELEKKGREAVVEVERKIFRKGGDGAAAAAEVLLSRAGAVPAAEIAAAAKAVADDAKRYGSRFETVTATRLANTLATNGPAEVALPYAQAAANATGLSAENRAKSLKILASVQRKLGKTAEADATQNEVTKLETVIDAEYRQKVPPFKPDAYAGRKDKANDRVVVLELFTGAECPPCVAADVAFDALTKSYPDKDVALLQYHLHIPGPDPLTTPDSVARFEYYGKKFEDAFGGTPSVAFDGKPAAGGGGPMAAGKQKYDDFTEVLNKALETKATATISGSAKRDGDALTGTIEVTVKEPTDSIKLRLVLAENEVKYVGGNGLRFHHHVVRGMVGTAQGVPVKALPGGKYELKTSVKDVREKLTKYLADYEGGFPNPERPLDLTGLKLVALVQDDASGAILQAKVIELDGK